MGKEAPAPQPRGHWARSEALCSARRGPLIAEHIRLVSQSARGASGKRSPGRARPRAPWTPKFPLSLLSPARDAGGHGQVPCQARRATEAEAAVVQFSLATLLLVVTVLFVALSVVLAPAGRQRRAVAAIEALGGSVGYVEPDLRTNKALRQSFRTIQKAARVLCGIKVNPT